MLKDKSSFQKSLKKKHNKQGDKISAKVMNRVDINDNREGIEMDHHKAHNNKEAMVAQRRKDDESDDAKDKKTSAKRNTEVRPNMNKGNKANNNKEATVGKRRKDDVFDDAKDKITEQVL
jgi:hypothetical protein